MEDQNLPLPGSLTQETVQSVTHWTENLFSFRLSRPQSFRFRSGEFVMAGLFANGKPLLRAYSIASPAWDDEVELYSIKVQQGRLTSRLQHLQPGDKVLLGKKPTGTLTLDALLPGKTLYMLSTGTGIAPFASVIRDPETYDKFERVVLSQTCRTVAGLKYGRTLVANLTEDPLIGEMVEGRLIHDTSATREDYPRSGRITNRIEDGSFFIDNDLPPFDPDTDRVMICGSTEMLTDTAALLETRGFDEGANSRPSTYVVEKAFVG
ncbi:MAG: ferredoxin--NADP reductase [Rhodospirillaceae bacterium]